VVLTISTGQVLDTVKLAVGTPKEAVAWIDRRNEPGQPGGDWSPFDDPGHADGSAISNEYPEHAPRVVP
jgi:hypothetical protein